MTNTGLTSYKLDFEGFARGTVMDDEYSDLGVHISSGDSHKPPMIFDTGNPTGGDDDLATDNLGNVLIISEDGDSHDPDDNAGGGKLYFDFDEPIVADSITVLDVEECARIRLFDEHGNCIGEFWGQTSDNGQQVIDLCDTGGVVRMEVTLYGSGAIDNFCFKAPDQLEPDGIVEGTEDDDDIDLAYDGDPNGDFIDNNDALLPGEGPQDDIVYAYGGDDTVEAGLGDDEVYGGSGNDQLKGEAGNDIIIGGGGDDVIHGGDGDDLLIGDGVGDCDPQQNLFPEWEQDISNIVLYFDADGDGEIDYSVKIDGFPDSGTPTFISNDLDDYFGQVLNYVYTENPDLVGSAVTAGVSIKGGIQPTQYFAVDGDTNGEAPDDGPLLNTGPGNDLELDYADFYETYDADLGGAPGVGSDSTFDDTIFGGNGDDTILGECGDDFLGAGDGNDKVYGGDGNDIIKGRSGEDTLFGDDGNDSIRGGEDDDTLFGGKGDDTLDGEGNDDIVYGGAGDDTVIGGGGEDSLFGGSGNDSILGNNNNDVIHGGSGNDTIAAGSSDDTVTGGTGDDTILGEAGKDSITGNAGNDVIDGGDNADLLRGGDGEDTVLGGSGNDIAFGGDDNDLVDGGTGDDTLDGGFGDDTVLGGDGEDYITGGTGDDSIDGGADNDSIVAGIGNDVVEGGTGDDFINAGNHVNPLPDVPYPGLYPEDPIKDNDLDTVFGGAGNDTILTGDDDDVIDGGTGDDFIDAGFDDDIVTGGTGNDTIIGGEGNDEIEGNEGDDLIYGGLDDSAPDFVNIPDDVDGDGVDSEPGEDQVTFNNSDTISGGDGNDTVFGRDDDDTLFGDAGNDYLDGGVDDDEIYGGDGEDTIVGGQGTDEQYGGLGSDTFLGGNGGDIVIGGEDPDLDGDGESDETDVLDLTGSNVDFITYTSADKEDGIVTFLDGSTMTFEEIENVIPCFTPGTTIATPRGERLVEELREGDRIITRDNGIQEIRWTGRKEMSGKALVSNPHLKPILIKAGALGHGLPERDMLVSPNHRVLVAGDKTQLYFEESEVLAAAKHLVGSEGIHEVDVMQTTYIHFMFDRHEVVLSNGAWTESFQPGDYSLKGIGNSQRNEIFELFPDLQTKSGVEGYQSARRSLKKHEARLLVK